MSRCYPIGISTVRALFSVNGALKSYTGRADAR